MIHIDENDPVGEIDLSFPYRDVQIKRGVDPKEHYDLQSELGRGKFGTVYRCKESATGLELAAKFIAVPKKEDRRNVEREVDIMRSLQHPRLLQLYDAFDNGKMMCLILELIEGGELFERVIDDDFILTEKSCTVFMRQICEGVDFIHKQRILHLDMKPENILCLTKTGNRVKIIDFGLARRFDPDKKLQVLFGTPEFVAPEVVNFDQIGYGTDMWSVGVICYVLISGLSPFMGGTDVETMANVTIAKYDFDDEAFQDISENAKDFIRKLLVKDMNARLSAEDCLKHDWLRRMLPVFRTPSMDVTKDNLRQFVERWNDHPNSPYVFELNSHSIAPVCAGGLQLSNSSESLSGMSPSPCASLASSPGSEHGFPSTQENEHASENGDLLLPLPLDHFRRASDSTCILKNSDVTERMNLAEEIRKLSDKLLQLSHISTSVTNNEHPFEIKPSTSKAASINQSLPPQYPPLMKTVPIKMTNTKFKADFPTDHPSSPNCNVPWRRTKYKVSQSSRDVPLMERGNGFQGPSTSNVFQTKVTYTSEATDDVEESPSDTKDLLLKLLEHWDGPQGPARLNTRHASVAAEMTDRDFLGQRTISSLNTFFQSRAANKKITPFHKF